MPKLKTRKSAAKRYKLTKNKNLLHKHAFKGHLLMKKSNKRKRKLAKTVSVRINTFSAIRYMLPYK